VLIKLLDILRIVIVAIAFYFGYQIGFQNGYDPVAQLHFMVPLIIVGIAGISGLEGLFFGKAAAEAKGYETGSSCQSPVVSRQSLVPKSEAISGSVVSL
jgi:hypothetical protein